MVHLVGVGGGYNTMLRPVGKRHDPEPEKSIEALRRTAVSPDVGAAETSSDSIWVPISIVAMAIAVQKSIPATPRPTSTKSFSHSPGSE